MKRIDIMPGSRFGRLTIVKELPSTSNGRIFLVQCDCGMVKAVYLWHLKSCSTKSCGCWRKDSCSNVGTEWGPKTATHGQSRHSAITPEYRAWKEMKKRCYNKNVHNYANYGGRGISVCDEWRDSLLAFLAYVGPRPSRFHSLDRFPDNNGNYEPGNVRWATSSEQAANKRPPKRAA